MSTPFPLRALGLRASGGLRTFAATAAATALALVLAAPVLAHADLVSSDPADKAVLATPPTTITLTFSETLDATKASFKLIGPGGTAGTGKVGADPAGMVLGGLALDPGSYEIQWTSASTDGHLLRGTLTFTVAQPTAAPATPPAASEAPSGAPTAAASPSTPATSPAASPAPAASPDPAAPASSSEGDVVLPIIVALVAVAGIGVLVLRRSRRA